MQSWKSTKDYAYNTQWTVLNLPQQVMRLKLRLGYNKMAGMCKRSRHWQHSLHSKASLSILVTSMTSLQEKNIQLVHAACAQSLTSCSDIGRSFLRLESKRPYMAAYFRSSSILLGTVSAELTKFCLEDSIHYHQDEWQKHYKPLSKRQTMETQ